MTLPTAVSSITTSAPAGGTSRAVQHQASQRAIHVAPVTDPHDDLLAGVAALRVGEEILERDLREQHRIVDVVTEERRPRLDPERLEGFGADGRAPAPVSASFTFAASSAAPMTHTSVSPVSPPPLTSRTGLSPSFAATCDHRLSGGLAPKSRSVVARACGPARTKSAVSREASRITTFSANR